MSNQIVIRRADERAIASAVRYARGWCNEHQWQLGVAEMALGASVLAYAVHTGALEVGREVVGSALSKFNAESLVGAATGSTAGAVAGALIGSIGVVPFGGIAISAVALATGGAFLFGATGYTVGDAVHKFLAPSFGDLLQGASLLTVGLALIVGGARRVIRDKRLLAAACVIKDHVLRLGCLATDVVARSRSELLDFLARHQRVVRKAGVVGATAAVTGGMATLGGLAATGSATVLGSHALGAAALSLGLVSAPLWPVIAGGAVGFGLSYALWSKLRRAGGRVQEP
jgi:hypothetical protein